MSEIEKTNLTLKSRGYRIKVAYFSGDTPISQAVGGFVTSVGGANYPCRRCYANKTDLFKLAKRRKMNELRKHSKLALATNKSIFGIMKVI